MEEPDSHAVRNRTPNIVIITSGRSGSGILNRVVSSLGWNAGDIDNEWGERLDLVALNHQQLIQPDSQFPDRLAQFLDSLRTPWTIKDPRIGRLWDYYQPVLESRNVLLILSDRDWVAVKNSFQKKDWDVSEARRTKTAAEKAFRRWNGAKLRIDHKQLCEAASLVDPNR